MATIKYAGESSITTLIQLIKNQLDTALTTITLTKNGVTTNLTSLNIIRLTQAEYNALVEAGTVDDTALYMITEEEVNASLPLFEVDHSVNFNFNEKLETGRYIIPYGTPSTNGPTDYSSSYTDCSLDVISNAISIIQILYVGFNRIYTRIGDLDPSAEGDTPVYYFSTWDNSISFRGLKVTGTTASTSTTTGALTVAGGVGVAGSVYASNVYGAVWNDYAEFRKCIDDFKSGNCVVEVGDDTMRLALNRLEPGAKLVSDTYGMIIGQTEEANCPIAVSGRVLAIPFEDRDLFRDNIGKFVCSGPNGTVSLMTDQEARDYPWAVVGSISGVPEYETWGSGNVEVKNRVWIYV